LSVAGIAQSHEHCYSDADRGGHVARVRRFPGHDDAVGDVVAYTFTYNFKNDTETQSGPHAEPDNTDTDITRVSARHKPRRLVLRASLRDITADSGGLYGTGVSSVARDPRGDGGHPGAGGLPARPQHAGGNVEFGLVFAHPHVPELV
jgi:hypothetical protein